MRVFSGCFKAFRSVWESSRESFGAFGSVLKSVVAFERVLERLRESFVGFQAF